MIEGAITLVAGVLGSASGRLWPLKSLALIVPGVLDRKNPIPECRSDQRPVRLGVARRRPGPADLDLDRNGSPDGASRWRLRDRARDGGARALAVAPRL